MFVALIGDSEIFFLALTAFLLCGVAIALVAKDCLRHRWTEPKPHND